MKYALTIALLLSGIFSNAQTKVDTLHGTPMILENLNMLSKNCDTVKVLAFTYYLPDYQDSLLYDGKEGRSVVPSPFVNIGLVKAWQVIPNPMINSSTYGYYHGPYKPVRYLAMNKKDTLTNVWEAKQIEW